MDCLHEFRVCENSMPITMLQLDALTFACLGMTNDIKLFLIILGTTLSVHFHFAEIPVKLRCSHKTLLIVVCPNKHLNAIVFRTGQFAATPEHFFNYQPLYIQNDEYITLLEEWSVSLKCEKCLYVNNCIKQNKVSKIRQQNICHVVFANMTFSHFLLFRCTKDKDEIKSGICGHWWNHGFALWGGRLSCYCWNVLLELACKL